MATETGTTPNNASTPPEGTTPPEGQGQQQTITPATGDQEGQQQTESVKIDDSTQLPETHPLVKANAKYKSDLAAQKIELAEARAKAGNATKLEEELTARPSQEALDTLQTRYDRLEEFLGAVGGPLSKALDSRTFTRDLFETDKNIADLVKDFAKANPTATSTALGSASAEPGKGKQDPNALLRAAAGH